MLKNILIGIVSTIIISLLTWIAISVKDVPYMKEKFDDNKVQHDRFDELIQQEIDKNRAYEIKLLELQWELKNIKSK